jgi:hypothetical protein
MKKRNGTLGLSLVESSIGESAFVGSSSGQIRGAVTKTSRWLRKSSPWSKRGVSSWTPWSSIYSDLGGAGARRWAARLERLVLRPARPSWSRVVLDSGQAGETVGGRGEGVGWVGGGERRSRGGGAWAGERKWIDGMRRDWERARNGDTDRVFRLNREEVERSVAQISCQNSRRSSFFEDQLASLRRHLLITPSSNASSHDMQHSNLDTWRT